jgi:protein ImuB
LLSGGPAEFSLDGARWQAVTAWAGPWILDERWWDHPARRRRARFQIALPDGTAHLLLREGGRWWTAATYD